MKGTHKPGFDLKTASPSFLTFIFLSILIIVFRAMYPPTNILSWDVFGYYLYLPAQFIYHDIGLNNIDWVKHIAEQYQTTSTLYQLVGSPEGGFVIKYSAGMALLNAPAFFIAHLLAQPLGFTADGFSLPYQYAWTINALTITCIGLYFFRKILLEYFTERLTVVLLIITALGTNYFQLTAFDGYLTHNFTFTLCTLITWFTIHWHKNPDYLNAIWLALSLGIIVLVRPSEMVCLLIPVFWGVYSFTSLKAKLTLLVSRWKQVLAMIAVFLVTGLPQLIYWKTVTGHFLFYSYVNAGEGFDFANPHTWLFLFSFRKGWLIYTPLMLLVVPGFISLYRNRKDLFYVVLFYFIVNLYVASSWTCWWYAGGSYSQRAMLTSYVLMAMPLGFLIRDLERNRFFRSFGIIVLCGFLILNLFQTWQWVHGIINPTRMTKDYYRAIFGRTEIPEGADGLLMVERSENEELINTSNYISRVYAIHDYEVSGTVKGNYCGEQAFSGNCAMQLDSAKRFTAAIEATFVQITRSDHAWLRVSAMVYPKVEPDISPASLVATFEHNGEPYKYKAEGIELAKYPVKAGKWNRIEFDYLTPEVRSKDDKLKVYFWLRGNQPVKVDDLKVEVWEPKVFR